MFPKKWNENKPVLLNIVHMHLNAQGTLEATCESGANEVSGLQQNSCTSARCLVSSDVLWRLTPALPFRRPPLSEADL